MLNRLPPRWGSGEPLDLAARADIEIPELKLNVLLSIRPNRDATPRASPRFEMHFIVPSNFSHRGIDSIPGIVMGDGIPLALSAVKVTDNLFEVDLREGLDLDRILNFQMSTLGSTFHSFARMAAVPFYRLRRTR